MTNCSFFKWHSRAPFVCGNCILSHVIFIAAPLNIGSLILISCRSCSLFPFTEIWQLYSASHSVSERTIETVYGRTFCCQLGRRAEHRGSSLCVCTLQFICITDLKLMLLSRDAHLVKMAIQWTQTRGLLVRFMRLWYKSSFTFVSQPLQQVYVSLWKQFLKVIYSPLKKAEVDKMHRRAKVNFGAIAKQTKKYSWRKMIQATKFHCPRISTIQSWTKTLEKFLFKCIMRL